MSKVKYHQKSQANEKSDLPKIIDEMCQKAQYSLLPHEYWEPYFKTHPRIAAACLTTFNNSSVERANFRALRMFIKSPNVSFKLFEAILFLRSLHQNFEPTYKVMARRFLMGQIWC